MKVSEAASRVIDLGHKITEYYETELRRRYPQYPLVDLDEDTVPLPPEEHELLKLLASLPDDVVYRLILLQKLGRGNFGTDELAESYAGLNESVGSAAQAVEEMMGDKVIVADELSSGLDELRKHNIPVDKLPLTKAKLRKR
jgi:hypothetical protein